VKTKLLIASIALLAVTITLVAWFVGCSSGTSESTHPQSRVPEVALVPEQPQVDLDRSEQVRRMAAEAQTHIRSQPEAEREQRTDELMSRAETHWKQQQYEYAGEITYPRNWRELGPIPQSRPGAVRQGHTEMDLLGSRRPEAEGPSNEYSGLSGPPGGRPGMGGMGGFGGGAVDQRGVVHYGWEGPVAVRSPDARIMRLGEYLAGVTEDEIWVIARERTPRAVGPEYDTPGSGAMLVEKGEEKIPLPLKHTDVKGRVCGYVATVEVVQQFHNPFSEKIEAVYVFPLPQNAAVNEFVMVIGERRIRGIIRERQEAEPSTARPAAKATSRRC
jgi:hypothetical protein